VDRGCESERIVVRQRFLHDPRCATEVLDIRPRPPAIGPEAIGAAMPAASRRGFSKPVTVDKLTVA
jgi:hypothetical protein